MDTTAWEHCRVVRCFKGCGIIIREIVVEEFLEIRNKILEDLAGRIGGGMESGLRLPAGQFPQTHPALRGRFFGTLSYIFKAFFVIGCSRPPFGLLAG
jgi:hypothetical protein